MTENQSAARDVKTVGFMIAAMGLSKLLGLTRTLLMARTYGVGIEAAAFFTAARIPLTIFDLFLGAAVLGSFIPIYNSFTKRDKADEFACVFVNFIILCTGVISILGVIFSEQIVWMITRYSTRITELSGEELAQFREMVRISAGLLRIMFPMIIFTGSTYVAVGLLQSKNVFLLPALVSSISNLGVIIYFIFLNDSFGIYGLAAAYLVSWLIQLVTLLIPLIKKGFRYRLFFSLANPALKKALKSALPIMAGSWLMPVGLLTGQIFAYSYPDPAAVVSAFEYSTQIYLLITGILVFGVCNFLFPRLSRQWAASDKEGFAKTVRGGIFASLALTAPFGIAAFVLNREIFAAMLMGGEFTSAAAESTAAFFRIYVPAMIAFTFIEFLNRVYYSGGKAIIPMTAALAGITANITCAYVFVRILGLPPVYIALAGVIGQFTAAGVLVVILPFKVAGIKISGVIFDAVRVLIPAALALLLMLWIHSMLGANPAYTGRLGNILNAFIVFTPGAVVYAGLLLVGRRLVKTEE